MATVIVSTYRHTCERCNLSWGSSLEKPKACTHCKSVYWNQPRQAHKYDAVRALEVGASIVIPWHERLGETPHPVDKVIKKLNLAGRDIRIEWKADGAHIKRWA